MGNANVIGGGEAEDGDGGGMGDSGDASFLGRSLAGPGYGLTENNNIINSSSNNNNKNNNIMGVSSSSSPPPSPRTSAGSPLMFAPQVPMVPLQKPDERNVGPFPHQTCDFSKHDDGFSNQLGIPVLIQWSHGGNEVLVEGSWDNWRSRIPLQKVGKDFTIVKLLPSGVYHYRFIVNGKLSYAPDLAWMYDEKDIVNNILDVQDYVPENPESVAGFEPPRSPDASYDDPFPGREDFSKEPPLVPPHLHLTLLNMESSTEVPSAALHPQHVILNHLYVEKGKAARSVVALGLTHRFRSKYVSVVLYKPIQR